NPPDGAMIDYYLKSAASGPVVLEITDQAGKLVRRFSSADKPEPPNEKEINVPMYWVRMLRTLSAEPGMHRWVWDLHYPEPKSLDREYPISAIYHDTPRIPLGPAVLPGTYTVKLTVGGKTFSQPLTIKMDPRVKTATADLTQQFQLEGRLSDLMNRDYDALEQVRSVRSQLQSRRSVAKSLPPQLLQAISDLDQKAATLDGSSSRAAARLGGGGDNLAALNSTLTSLLNAVDSTDVLPTTQQVAAVN